MRKRFKKNFGRKFKKSRRHRIYRISRGGIRL